MQDILEKQVAVTNEKLDLSNDYLMRIRSLTESVLYSVRGQFNNTEKLLEYAEDEAKFRSTERTLEAERDRTAMVKALEKIAENTDNEKQGPEKKDKDMNLGAWGLAIAAALGGIVGAITGYVQAIVKLNKILFSAIGSAANAIVQFFPGLRRMLFNIQANIAVGMAMIKDSVKTVFGKIVEKFAAVVDVVDDAIRRVLNGKVIKSIVEVFNKVVTSIKAFFAPIVEAFKTIGRASGSVGGIVATIRSKIGMLLEMFSNIGKYFTTFSKVFTAVATIAKKIALPLTIIMTAWDVIKGIMSGWEEGGLVGAIGGAVKGLFNSLVFGVADMIKGAISWIAGALGFEGVEKFLDSFSFKDIFSDFVDAVLFIPQTIQNIIMHPIDTLKKLGDTLKSAFDAVVSKFKIFTDFLSGIGDMLMEYIVDPLIRIFEPIAGFFKNIKEQIFGFLEDFGIPEVAFTIPIINKKVSIGPFYPFRPEEGTARLGGSASKSESSQGGTETSQFSQNTISTEKDTTSVLTNRETSIQGQYGTGATSLEQNFAQFNTKTGKAMLSGDTGEKEISSRAFRKIKSSAEKNTATNANIEEIVKEDEAYQKLGFFDKLKVDTGFAKAVDLLAEKQKSTVVKEPKEIKTIDNGDGSKTAIRSDGSKVVTDGGGTKTYDKNGKLISEKSPTFMGVSTEKRADGTVINSYDAGPMSLSKSTFADGSTKANASYDLGVAKAVNGNIVYDQSSKNAEIAMKPAQSAPVIVSAPTNVSNNNSQSIAMPAPIRNDDNGITKYISKNARYF